MKTQMSNQYAPPYVSIIPGEGLMWNEATTHLSNHNYKNVVNNDNTNLIRGVMLKKRTVKRKPTRKGKR